MKSPVYRVAALSRPASAAAVASMAVGGLVLLGWALDIAILKSVSLDWVTMKANTAICFVLAGLSLWFLREEDVTRQHRLPSQAVAAFVALVGLLTLMEYLFHADFGIDELLFKDSPSAVQTSTPGRMSPAAALNFLLIGLALLGLDWRTPGGLRPAQTLPVLALAISLVASIGYLYGVKPLSAIAAGTSISLHTALAFIVLSLGLLYSRPGQGPFGFFTRSGMGASLARRLLPVAVGIPVSLGWLGLKGKQAGFYDFEMGLAIFAASNIFIFSGVIWATAVSLNRAEAALRSRENQLQFVADHAPVAIAQYDSERHYKFVNRPYAAMLGKLPAEIIGQHPRDVLGEKAYAHASPYMTAVLAGQPTSYELRLPGTSDGPRVVHGQYAPERDSDGQVVGFIAAILDVTGQKQAEAQLRRINDELQQRVLNRTAELEAANQELAFQNDEKGKRAAELIIANQELAFQRDEKGKRADELVIANQELAFQRDEKGKRADELVIANQELAFQNNEKEKRADELVIANQELAFQRDEKGKRADELVIANQELDSFSYSVSHDLRSPLRAIDGFALILEEDYAERLDDEGRRCLKTVQGEAQRMGRLIDDLLNFSRLGRQQLISRRVDMEALARSVFEELKKEQPSRPVELTLGRLPHAVGDSGLLRQLLVNLLGNALKYSSHKEQSRVEVGAEVGDGMVTYFVRDNGAGFDMRFVDKLFGIFQRLHTDEEFSGTGVGLALVKRIVIRHGGRVWAEGKLGEGATFFFTLPAGTTENHEVPVAESELDQIMKEALA